MNKSNKDKLRRRFRKIIAGVTLGIGTVAASAGVLLSGGYNASSPEEATPWADPANSSSTSTDAELPDTINVYGQDVVKESFNFDPIKGDWNIMLIRQSREMRDPAKRQAFLDFMKQFDDLKDQFRSAGGKSPESIDAIVQKVNQRVSDQFKDHATFINDYTSPIETIGNHYGNSQDIATMNEAALQYIGLSDNRMLLARVNSQGDASKGPDLVSLLVNDAPEGAPPHFVAVTSHVNQLRGVDQHPGQDALIDARNQRGAFFTPGTPKAGPNLG